MKRYVISAIAAAAMLVGTAAHAGAFILAGTDADDHGGVSAGVNQTGWEFMQKALQNLAPNVTNGNQVVTILGSTSGALTAASSAFNLSTLVGAGWTLQTIGTADFGAFFGNSGAFALTGAAASGILMMDSGNNIGGGVDDSNYNAVATAIDTFIDNGGGLFSQANGYSWLNALLPSLGVTLLQDTGLAVTAAGATAFPGLTNADLSSGPWHNYFTNVGALNVFATSTNGSNQSVIIGAVTGSITNPGRIPEPTTVALVGLALLGAAAARRKGA